MVRWLGLWGCSKFGEGAAKVPGLLLLCRGDDRAAKEVAGSWREVKGVWGGASGAELSVRRITANCFVGMRRCDGHTLV